MATPENTSTPTAEDVWPLQQTSPAFVCPSTGTTCNTHMPDIRAVRCLRLEDMLFEFDLSFVRPEIRKSMERLGQILKLAPKALLSIFGHADPVGPEEYNKKLSGRRAIAIYALLTRRDDLWETLYSEPIKGGGDNWAAGHVSDIMLFALGFEEGAAGIRRFQRKNALNPSGKPDQPTRKVLFLKYMDKICPIRLKKDQFLGKGADGGKADYQGCGEYNLQIIFSKKEEEDFSRPEKKHERNAANAPNRRVVIYLFPEDSKLDPEWWPCPKASEPTLGCLCRFWCDGEARLVNLERRREYAKGDKTYACRWYEWITLKTECEKVPVVIVPLAFLCVRVFFHQHPMEGLEVSFYGCGPDGGIGELMEPSSPLKTGKDGVVRWTGRFLGAETLWVAVGNYWVKIEHEPPLLISTVENSERPFVIVLPVGRPYSDVEGDQEFGPPLT